MTIYFSVEIEKGMSALPVEYPSILPMWKPVNSNNTLGISVSTGKSDIDFNQKVHFKVF